MAREVGQRVSEEYPRILALVEKNKYASAYKTIEDWPEETWGGKLGQDFAMLSGFLDYKAEFYGDALDELKPLADDPEFVKRRPELLYYLGRAYYANASSAKAVDALERFIELQSRLGRPLLPASARRPSEALEKGQAPAAVVP
jgi:tetratricopeptide (TPR) repeat protein